MPRLYYFQAPNFDINPESDEAPRLGSIFPNLDRFTAPLNQFDHVSVPAHLTNRSATSNFTETVNRSINVYAFARDRKKVYRCSMLETEEFEPTAEFVAECVRASNRVQEFLANALVGRRRVYMVTGLKIATGFSASVSEEARNGPTLRIAAATAFGFPVETGVGLGLAIGGARTVESGSAANRIVFAYRAVRIKQRWDGEVRYKYKGGGKYGVDDDDSDDGNEQSWVVEPLDEEDRLRDFPDSVMLEIENEGGTGRAD